MSNPKLKTAYILTAIIAALTLIASAGGLLIDDLYRDNALITAGWFGNDLVTLVVALPLLVVSLALSMRGSQRARLIWLGMIAYTLYNFSYYLFGTAFNSFFLIYVALFDLSLFALIYGLIGLDGTDIGQRFRAPHAGQGDRGLYDLRGPGPDVRLHLPIPRIRLHRHAAGDHHTDGQSDQRRLRLGSHDGGAVVHRGGDLAVATPPLGLRPGDHRQRQGRRLHAGADRRHHLGGYNPAPPTTWRRPGCGARSASAA